MRMCDECDSFDVEILDVEPIGDECFLLVRCEWCGNTWHEDTPVPCDYEEDQS